jgi:plastocyanin
VAVALVASASSGFAAVAGCTKNPAGPAPIAQGTGTSVRIQGDAYATGNAVFSPQTLTTNVGATVTWTNADSVVHSNVADAGQWRNDNIAVNGTFQFTFATAGTYTYKCTLHSGMTGSVIVR